MFSPLGLEVRARGHVRSQSKHSEGELEFDRHING